MKITSLSFVSAAFILTFSLMSCSVFLDEEYIAGKYKRYLEVLSKKSDSYGNYSYWGSFYTMDNLGFNDQFNEQIQVTQPLYYDYKAISMQSGTYITLSLQSGFNGGSVFIFCKTESNYGIEFKNYGNNTLFYNGYSLSFEDSLEVDNKTYKDVIIFDATEGKDTLCHYDKLYFAAEIGLFKMDKQDTISTIRQ